MIFHEEDFVNDEHLYHVDFDDLKSSDNQIYEKSLEHCKNLLTQLKQKGTI